MKINCVKQINVQLSVEEKDTLLKAREILCGLYEAINEENCDYVIYETEYDGEMSYQVNEISSLIDQLDNLTNITEIC